MVTQLQFSPETERIWAKCYESQSFRVPFYTYNWHKAWYDVFADQAGDQVGGQTSDIEPLLLYSPNTSHIIPLAIFPDGAHFFGGEEISDYLDIIGNEDQKAAVWEEVVEELRAQHQPALILRNLPEHSNSLQFFSKIAKKEDTTPQLMLPKTWQEYVDGLNADARHEMQRKMRKFERAFEQPTIEVANNLAQGLETLLTLMKRNEEKRAFLTPTMEKFFRTVPTSLPNNTRILTLRVEGEVAAAVLVFSDKHTLWLYNSGYDEYRFSGAGLYLKTKSIQYAIETGHAAYNFLQGNERYKYDLGGKDFFVYSATSHIA